MLLFFFFMWGVLVGSAPVALLVTPTPDCNGICGTGTECVYGTCLPVPKTTLQTAHTGLYIDQRISDRSWIRSKRDQVGTHTKPLQLPSHQKHNAQRTTHKAQSTKHKAQSTRKDTKHKKTQNKKLKTQSKKQKAQSTKHKAQRTTHTTQNTKRHNTQSTAHSAQSTKHKAQSTKHKAQSTKHKAQSTKHCNSKLEATSPNCVPFLAKDYDIKEVTLSLFPNCSGAMARLASDTILAGTPGGSMYGKWKTKQELDELVRPSAHCSAIVKEWLLASGVADFKEDVELVRFSAPSEVITSLLDLNPTKTNYGYRLPSAVFRCVAAVFFSVPKITTSTASRSTAIKSDDPATKKSESTAAKSKDSQPQHTHTHEIPLSEIKTLYEVDGVLVPQVSRGKQAVFGLGGTFSPEDLAVFFQRYVGASPPEDASLFVLKGDPIPNSTPVSEEYNFDMQAIMGMAPGVRTEFYFYNEINEMFAHGIHRFASDLLASDDPPLVVSMSVGANVAATNLLQLFVTARELAVLEQSFMKLASRGITVCVASGDEGSSWSMDPAPTVQPYSVLEEGAILYVKEFATALECLYNRPYCQYSAYVPLDGTADNGNCTCFQGGIVKNIPAKVHHFVFKNGGATIPLWPGSSPWVTSIGATRKITEVGGYESAMMGSGGGSGGGFSPFQPIPQWQANAGVVPSFLESQLVSNLFTPPPGSYPPLGRAIPDFACLGQNILYVLNQDNFLFSGTSASTPLSAGMIALLNEKRLANGKSQMGFFNPFVYNNDISRQGFTDIVEGSNRPRTKSPLSIFFEDSDFDVQFYGWNTGVGWDAVTGVGTPKFDIWLQAIEVI